MQPTFRQVPPRVPRFSMQVTYAKGVDISSSQHNFDTNTYLHALLASLDGGDIASDTTSDDDKVLVL